MNTKLKLSDGLKEALRAKDELRKRTLRMALAAIKNTEIDRRSELDEASILAILQKEVKNRQETIEGAQQARRDDLIAEAEAEIAVLEEFLPQPLTAEELEKLARQAIADSGAISPREMGVVMRLLMPKIQGRADGKEASQMVQRLLNQ